MFHIDDVPYRRAPLRRGPHRRVYFWINAVDPTGIYRWIKMYFRCLECKSDGNFIDPIVTHSRLNSATRKHASREPFQLSLPLFYRRSQSTFLVFKVHNSYRNAFFLWFVKILYAVLNVSRAFICRFQCKHLGTIFRQTLTAFCRLARRFPPS